MDKSWIEDICQSILETWDAPIVFTKYDPSFAMENRVINIDVLEPEDMVLLSLV